jgi:hypothetical protein
VIPPLTAEDIPAEAAGLRAGLAGMLPFAPIASLLVELDVRTGFLGCFTHAGGRKQARSADLKRNIIAVLIAQATNLGLVRPAPPGRRPDAARQEASGRPKVTGPAEIATLRRLVADGASVTQAARTLKSPAPPRTPHSPPHADPEESSTGHQTCS